MDFRPDSKTLAINYSVTFGIVIGLILLSVGSYQRYYYSPEYTSHQGYGTPVSCESCHTKPWHAVDQKTCSTAGCHVYYSPDFNSGNVLMLDKDEKGKPKPGLGSMIAFHRQVSGTFSCEQCHPSHRLPQTAKFNAATIALALQSQP